MRSNAFNELMRQIQATGIAKLDGYESDILERIPEEEKRDAEKAIVEAFLSGDSAITVLIKNLRYYDGKSLLLEELQKCNKLSGRSIEIIFALADKNLSQEYYDILMLNYVQNKSRLMISERLMKLSPSYELFCFYEQLSRIASEGPELTSIANGLLYCSGLLKNPGDIHECIALLKENEVLSSKDNAVRARNIQALKNAVFSNKDVISVRQINENLQKKILYGAKTSHSTSRPVIYQENGKYYLAVFVFYFNREDIEAGAVDRPTLWAIADMETGEILERRDTKKHDFSDASYDVKYNVRADGKYDTSREYYDRAFAILDSVRHKLITTGEFHAEEYQVYLDKIIANIPKAYQRFYLDLSI